MDVEAIRARWAAGTPGPWRVGYAGCDDEAIWAGDALIAEVEHERDIDAIAAAPDDIAALLAEVGRLRAALARAVGVLVEEDDRAVYCHYCGNLDRATREHRADCPARALAETEAA